MRCCSFYEYGKSIRRDYFIHDDGRYMLSVIDLESDCEVWCGEVPKLQYKRALNRKKFYSLLFPYSLKKVFVG